MFSASLTVLGNYVTIILITTYVKSYPKVLSTGPRSRIWGEWPTAGCCHCC